MDLATADADRAAYLRRLYDLSPVPKLANLDMWAVGADVGLSRDETERVFDYLAGQKLARYVAAGGQASITHEGVLHVEEGCDDPELEFVVRGRRERRLAVLNHLCTAVEGSTRKSVMLREIADALGISEDDSFAAADYLRDEGLIEYATMGPTIVLTPGGVAEVEAALRGPTPAETEHFPLQVVMNVAAMYVSNSLVAINSPGATQTMNTNTNDLAQIRELIRDVITALTDDDEAHAPLAGALHELDRPHPEKSMVRELLQGAQTALGSASTVAGQLSTIITLVETLPG